MANDVENGSHFNYGYAAVGAATNGEAIDSTSQNNNSVYFDKQEGRHPYLSRASFLFCSIASCIW